MSFIKFGTCSWKYDSWKGIIYPDIHPINYLKEYSKHFDTVEVDQWFWSLFGSKVKLPGEEVTEYKNSVPKNFLFTIKVPNSLTLTHYYKSNEQNPYFLSVELFEEFLLTLKPVEKNIGCLMFQFEYLNKQKMQSLQHFQLKLQQFCAAIPGNCPPIAIELRNPNYLNEAYFRALNDMNFAHVFLEGYFMPPIVDTFNKFKDYIRNFTVIRLHGPDRKGIEKISGENWNRIYVNRDEQISRLKQMIMEIKNKDVNLYINVNNHFEGSAPLTIQKIKKMLDTESSQLMNF